MAVAAEVKQARNGVYFTVRELARSAGVSASTISRIESGQLDPSVSTYRKIMAATGLPSAVPTAPATREVFPVEAARYLLDDLGDCSSEARMWVERFTRLGWVDSAGDVVAPVGQFLFRVGRMSRLIFRRGVMVVVDRAGSDGSADLLRRGDVDFAISGPAALAELGATQTNLSTVAYVSDVDRAVSCLDTTDYEYGDGIPAIILPFDGVSEVGSVDGWASPLQAILDGFAGSSRMPEMSEEVLTKLGEAA